MAWLAHHRDGSEGDDRKNFQARIFQNEVQALELKTKRKEFSRARKEARAPMQSIPEDVPLVAENVHMYEHIDDDDLESVNLHAALLSTPHLPDLSRFRHEEGHTTRYADRNSPRASYVSCKTSTHLKDKSSVRLDSPVSPLTPRAEQEYFPPRAKWQSADEEPTPRNNPTQRQRYRSSEDAAQSYANILPRSNPFVTHTGNNNQASGIKGTSSTPMRPPPSSSHASPVPESVWTDADPHASKRSSLSSLMDKYANYGGLPIPPDIDVPHSSDHQRSNRQGDVSAHRPPPTSHPLRRSTNVEDALGPKDKARKHLAPEDLVKRANSTRSENRQRDPAQLTHRPPPIKVDRAVPEDSKVSVENLVKRAVSKSNRSEGAARRYDHHPSSRDAEVKQPAPSRTDSVDCNTLASSSLLGDRGRRDREADQTSQRPRRESREPERARPAASDAPQTNVTRWSMDWKDEVMNRPENKFYKDRLEREREEARRAAKGTKERMR